MIVCAIAGLIRGIGDKAGASTDWSNIEREHRRPDQRWVKRDGLGDLRWQCSICDHEDAQYTVVLGLPRAQYTLGHWQYEDSLVVSKVEIVRMRPCKEGNGKMV